MREFRCPACSRYLGEFEGKVRLTSCPGCSSEIHAETAASGFSAVEFRIPSQKRRGPFVAVHVVTS